MKNEKKIVIAGQEFVIKRWTFGEKAACYKNSMIITDKGKDLDINEFVINVLLYCVEDPKLTREQILNMDPDIVSFLFKEAMKLNKVQLVRGACLRLRSSLGLKVKIKLVI